MKKRDSSQDSEISTASSSSSHVEASYWSGIVSSAFSIFDSPTSSRRSSSNGGGGSGSWKSSSVKRIVTCREVMRRFQDRLLGTTCKIGISSSTCDIWFLGVCYKPLSSPSNEDDENGVAAFELDFSSRILMTYRKGFNAIGDSKYTSDVNWGCMLRSSQMLVAQALLFHRLGRSWRKPSQKLMDREYIELLHLFGDNEESPFSIHNLIQAGKSYGLAAGSWVGPYAMCRSWETLARIRKEESEIDSHLLPMAVYIVSGDEDGERGGAPVVCIEDASRHCFEFSNGQLKWTPVLLLVPLVLGLDKVNPRYIPLLEGTFTFPQSLGILGGKPGASTYIVGVQDAKAFYLDPHEVQPAVDISIKNLEADTASYHCNVIRHIPLDLIDSSLAIGFYCRDKDDFDDFCRRASQLVEQSSGAPLFTVTETNQSPKQSNHNEKLGGSDIHHEEESYDVLPEGNEDDWQLL